MRKEASLYTSILQYISEYLIIHTDFLKIYIVSILYSSFVFITASMSKQISGPQREKKSKLFVFFLWNINYGEYFQG